MLQQAFKNPEMPESTTHRSRRLLSVISPARGGVWDFAHALAQELGTTDQIVEVASGDRRVFADVQTEGSILHLSGYGFARRGAPMWLVSTIARNRRRLGRFGVFFHELYAQSWPWSSAFWMSPLQRYVARNLAETADFWLTTCHKHATWLTRYAGHKPHAVLPIPSNVGEVRTFQASRDASIAVFGSASLRASAYDAASEALFFWAQKSGLTIHDIGPEIIDNRVAQRCKRAGIVQHGFLSSSEASALLANARYGIVRHRSAELAKSSIFAAYCAHGVCPVVVTDSYVAADGLQPAQHYCAGIPLGNHDRDLTALESWRWYGQHRLAHHAEAIDRLLSESGSLRRSTNGGHDENHPRR